MSRNTLTLAVLAFALAGGFYYWKTRTPARKVARRTGSGGAKTDPFSALPGPFASLARRYARIPGGGDPATQGAVAGAAGALPGVAKGIAGLFAGASGPESADTTRATAEDEQDRTGQPDYLLNGDDGTNSGGTTDVNYDAQGDNAANAAEFPRDNLTGFDAASNMPQGDAGADLTDDAAGLDG